MFGYMRNNLINENYFQEEINGRFNSGNACYHSVQNLLSSSFLSKNLKIKICKTINLPAVLYGCETWSLTLRDERRLRVLENRLLRRIFGLKRDEVTKKDRKLNNEEINVLLTNIIRVTKTRRVRLKWHVARTDESRGVCRVLWGNLREIDHLEEPGIDVCVLL